MFNIILQKEMIGKCEELMCRDPVFEVVTVAVSEVLLP